MTSGLLPILFFFLSLAVVSPAFFSWGWMLKLTVIEWGHWLGLACLGLALISLALRRPALSHGLVYFIAAFLFFLPLIDVMTRDVPSADKTALLDFFFPEKIPDAKKSTIPFQRSGLDLPIDFYSGVGPGTPRPLVIMIYGGSWTKGERTDLSELNFFLANAGFNVAAVTYRLAPAVHFPGPIEDVSAATDFLIENSAVWNIDPARIYFMGRSAGGQIAELAALSAVKKGNSVKGIISLYAPADLIWGVEITSPWQIINGEVTIGSYLGVHLDDTSRKLYEAASPVFQVDEQTPRHLLIHGISDELVSIYHSRKLTARLRDLGRPVALEELRWATHGFDYFYQSPNGTFLRKRVLRFLAED